MRKRFLQCIFVSVVGLLIASCVPNRFYLINSEGLLTYNRHTGQLEFLWNTKAKGGQTDSSSVKNDSIIKVPE